MFLLFSLLKNVVFCNCYCYTVVVYHLPFLFLVVPVENFWEQRNIVLFKGWPIFQTNSTFLLSRPGFSVKGTGLISNGKHDSRINVFIPEFFLNRPVLMQLVKKPAIVYTVSQKDLFLALKMGLFRWVEYSPIFESTLVPLNQGRYGPIT